MFGKELAKTYQQVEKKSRSERKLVEEKNKQKYLVQTYAQSSTFLLTNCK